MVKGGFYIHRTSTYKCGWRLLYRTETNGKITAKTVKKTALLALGFTLTMSPDKASELCIQLNAQNAVKRAEAHSIAATAARVERDALYHAAFVPKDLNDGYITRLEQDTTGKGRAIEKAKIQWSTAKKAIIKLGLLPENYADNKKRIYLYFASHEYSLSYTLKLIRQIDLFGAFVSKLRGKFYEPIPRPRGHDREMINDAYFSSDGYRGASEPLTPEMLNDIKDQLKEPQYNWLYCSLWFGLRPSELDAMLEDRKQVMWRVEDGDTDILWVYQAKQSSLPRPKRWKPIPIIYAEQKIALDTIYRGNCKKPLTKTIQRYTGIHCTRYGGRKAFTDVMLGLGQKLEDIAHWLGHSSIAMTWSHYKDKSNVRWSKPA